MASEQPHEDALDAHRRLTRRDIYGPLYRGLALIGGLTVIALLVILTVGRQSPIADILSIVLLLCPAAICLFPLYLALVLGAYGVNRAHDGMIRPLRGLERLSDGLLARAQHLSHSLARASINFNTRTAVVDRVVFSHFDRPEDRAAAPNAAPDSQSPGETTHD
ncbi:MAG: hypothetical protein GYB67_10235 [Chloroflexi bacterium]|nr:hypothetical protein [Chloroflexota bacterium]